MSLSLYLNHIIIEEQGFKKLQNAILINLDHLDTCECKRKIERTINVNAHVFIEANVRKAQNMLHPKIHIFDCNAYF